MKILDITDLANELRVGDKIRFITTNDRYRNKIGIIVKINPSYFYGKYNIECRLFSSSITFWKSKSEFSPVS